MNTLLSIGGKPLILLIVLAGLVFPEVSFAFTGNETGYERTQEEMRARWKSIRPGYSDTPFELRPVIGHAFTPGRLAGSFVEDALRVTNYIRYLAGLPSNVVLDEGLMVKAQYGAVLLSSTDQFAHDLLKPALLPEDFYLKGLSSTMTSNISRGFSSIESAIRNGYMRDDDEYNLRTLGHRRWILNPRFGRTGFGYAEGIHYGMDRPIGDSTMQVHDFSAPEPDYDYIAWPAPGYFPREFFDSDDPWSITVNPMKYLAPDPRSIQVVLTRVRDKYKWILNNDDSNVSSENEFFTVNLERFGVANAIIFRPVPAMIRTWDIPTETGDPMIEATEFRVDIYGLRHKDGVRAVISYSVTFFDLEPLTNPTQHAGRAGVAGTR